MTTQPDEALNMKKTDVYLIIDESGSMHHLKSTVLHSVNEFIEHQKNLGGKCRFSLTTFNSTVRYPLSDLKMKDVKRIESDDYSPGGMTALLDAIGSTILAAKLRRRNHQKVLVTMTDGMENNSTEFDIKMIRKMIRVAEKDNWQILFLGANIDAIGEGGRMGVNKDRSMNMAPTGKAFRATIEMSSEKISAFRSGIDASIDFTEEDREIAMGGVEPTEA